MRKNVIALVRTGAVATAAVIAAFAVSGTQLATGHGLGLTVHAAAAGADTSTEDPGGWSILAGGAQDPGGWSTPAGSTEDPGGWSAPAGGVQDPGGW